MVKALCSDNGGKLKAGNENPAAAATCNDCNNAAECSCALRRSSATDVVRGSLPDVVVPDNDVTGDELDDTADDVPPVLADERLDANDEMVAAAAADDVIVGQHEHKPGNAILGTKKWTTKENYT